MSRFLLFSCLFFGFWLFLGQHHHLIDKSGNPFFRERETLVVLADIEHHTTTFILSFIAADNRERHIIVEASCGRLLYKTTVTKKLFIPLFF